MRIYFDINDWHFPWISVTENIVKHAKTVETVYMFLFKLNYVRISL